MRRTAASVDENRSNRRMEINKAQEQILASLKGGPVPIDELADRLIEKGLNDRNVMRAVWRLLSNRQARLTEDRELGLR